MPYFRAILTFLAVLVLVGCNSMSPPKKAELGFLDRVKIKQVKELSESEYDAYMSEAVDELKELISKGRGSPYLALKSMNYDAEYDTIEEVSYIDLARMSKDNDRDFSRNGPKINAWGNARSLYQLQFMYTSAQAFCSTPYTPSALTKVDPPVLKIIDPPSAQFLRFTSSASALTSANTNWPTLCTLYQPIA